MRGTMVSLRSVVATALCGVALLLSFGMARADTFATASSTGTSLYDPLLAPLDDPLHGFCYGDASCAEAKVGPNMVTPTLTQTNLDFGFTISPGPQTGYFYVYILTPDLAGADALSFSVTGTQTGALNTGSITTPVAASLVSNTPWTTGFLDTYLGISASPTNSLSSFLDSTNTLVPSATGYYVYQVKLGMNRLYDNPNAMSGPLLELTSSSSPLALGSLIVGFLKTYTLTGGVTWIATASSGAIFEAPEPATLLIVASGLLLLWAGFRLRRTRIKP
jgi:hypothetical protein